MHAYFAEEKSNDDDDDDESVAASYVDRRTHARVCDEYCMPTQPATDSHSSAQSLIFKSVEV